MLGSLSQLSLLYQIYRCPDSNQTDLRKNWLLIKKKSELKKKSFMFSSHKPSKQE